MPLPCAAERDGFGCGFGCGRLGGVVESGVGVVAFALVAASVGELAVGEVEGVAAFADGDDLVDLHAAGVGCPECGVDGLSAQGADGVAVGAVEQASADARAGRAVASAWVGVGDRGLLCGAPRCRVAAGAHADDMVILSRVFGFVGFSLSGQAVEQVGDVVPVQSAGEPAASGESAGAHPVVDGLAGDVDAGLVGEPFGRLFG